MVAHLVCWGGRRLLSLKPAKKGVNPCCSRRLDSAAPHPPQHKVRVAAENFSEMEVDDLERAREVLKRSKAAEASTPQQIEPVAPGASPLQLEIFLSCPKIQHNTFDAVACSLDLLLSTCWCRKFRLAFTM